MNRGSSDRISRFQKNAFGSNSSRGFASSARVAEAEVSIPVVAETIIEEPTKATLIEPIIEIIPEGVLPLADSIPTPIPPPVIELPSVVEELVDAANIAVVNLSGSVDLSSLEGSWGLHPIMRFQSLFINLHESFPLLGHGLPWYILIPTVTLGLRLLLFTFQVRAQSNAARMAIIQPQMLAGMEKLKAAKARGDFMGAQTAQIETQTLMAVNNVNPIKNLAFPLAQAAVFMTMFFALKGLAGAGIPSLATEGLGWVQNLTEPDPYWVLPIASTTLTLATLEVSLKISTRFLKN